MPLTKPSQPTPRPRFWRRWPIPLAVLFGLGALAADITREPRQWPEVVIVQPSLESNMPLPYPVMFVTQVPVRNGYTTVAATFGNHRPDVDAAPRGGDLWIRYPNGVLKNLTKAFGLGQDGLQGDQAIAVRDPSIHWDGRKAVFSMVTGSTGLWQLFEVTGLELEDAPLITKVPNQPAYNNISPTYGTDDRIIFTTDRPRGGETHLYPQRDEYEGEATATGLWSLDPSTGDVRLLNHAPSGDFTPIVDSFGRVLFTQWDHLQRDQLSDRDRLAGGTSGTFDYASEAADAAKTTDRLEVFPEPHDARDTAGTNLNAHDFNHFFPWTVNEDGTDGEVLNHLGRHEFRRFLPPSINTDPNLVEFDESTRFNQNAIDNLFQIREDPRTPGRYIGVNAPDFFTHGSGQIVSVFAPPGKDAAHIGVTYITSAETYTTTEENAQPSPAHSGHYRDPVPLSDGTLVAAHTFETRMEAKTGPSRYDFRLRTLRAGPNGAFVADKPITPGLRKSLENSSAEGRVPYQGELWELGPVEVRARPRPPSRSAPALEPPEAQMFLEAGVRLEKLREFLVQNDLALMVTRNVTSRDRNDRQQPFNLRVPGGTSSVAAPGQVYDVSHLQLFQADQLRGLGGPSTPRPGRRVLARSLNDANALKHNRAKPGDPAGSVKVAADGSIAAFVPTRRALSWQLLDPSGQPVVRERYWVTFQPGEVRVCGSCHGVSERDQLGRTNPSNPPQALLELLREWKPSSSRP